MQDESTEGPMQRRAPVAPITAEEAARFERALAYLRAHFRTATLSEVAAHVGLSPFHFHRRFSLWAGRTPKTIRTELQLECARQLLLKGEVPLRKIAVRCGFAHQAHFTQRFGVYNDGVSPLRWRRARLATLDGGGDRSAKAA